MHRYQFLRAERDGAVYCLAALCPCVLKWRWRCQSDGIDQSRDEDKEDFNLIFSKREVGWKVYYMYAVDQHRRAVMTVSVDACVDNTYITFTR